MTGMRFEGRPTADERAMRAAQARRDAEREEELRRLHTRLDAVLFWAAIMLALGAIGLQLGWAP